MEIYKPKTLDEAKILLFNNENSKKAYSRNHFAC